MQQQADSVRYLNELNMVCFVFLGSFLLSNWIILGSGSKHL